MNVLNVVGARPNIMKVAPIHKELEHREGNVSRIVHTGQHYDEQMSDIFFQQLGLPKPDIYLGVGSASHAQQTARIMSAFEPVLKEESPDVLVVVGDVNSTLACALVSVKLGVPVVHVEAGLRSFDRSMPEEINRIVTDSISDLLLVSEQSGMDNLRLEGVPEEKTVFVGNVMIDTLVLLLETARQLSILKKYNLSAGWYALVTMHRPSNVDDFDRLDIVVTTLECIGKILPMVFPAHPRTIAKLKNAGLYNRLKTAKGVHLVEPLGYLEFIHLMDNAAIVITDSGGIQEETTYLGIPCLTVRDNTERPSTIEMGTNRLVSLSPDRIMELVGNADELKKGAMVPPLWDGHTSSRIVDAIQSHIAVSNRSSNLRDIIKQE
jgi:UDP-N-acetylglucosamine 2-epimerase (non-hydrolysing)